MQHAADALLGSPLRPRDAPYGTRRGQVLELVRSGLDAPAIAARLGVAERTVNYHLQHLRAELGPEAIPAPRHPSSAGAAARRLEVLRLKAEGAANRDIALQLQISAGMVRDDVERLYEELGIHNQAGARRVAREMGLAP